MKLYTAAGESPYLKEFILRLWNAFPWTTAWQVPGRGELSIADHSAIMECVRARDAAGAGELIRKHILHGKQFVIQKLDASRTNERRTRKSANLVLRAPR
jgi:DNA-binding GntR family transcriptional regulator